MLETSAVDLVRNHGEKVIDLRAEKRQGDQRHDDDQRHDEGVFGEALTPQWGFVVHDHRSPT